MIADFLMNRFRATDRTRLNLTEYPSMKKLSSRIVTSLIVSCSLSAPYVLSATDNDASNKDLGSGFAEVKGKTINYEYRKFGGFYVNVQDSGRVKWRGFVGAFKDIVREVDPIYSKVADDLYFFSWETRPSRGDNVVFDLKNNTVHAHLGGGDDPGFTFISGDVYCFDTPDCKRPHGDTMGPEETMEKLAENAAQSGMTLEQSIAGEPGEDDANGKQQLTGKTIAYQTDEGIVRVAIDDDQTTVTTGDNEATTHLTHATVIVDGIWFVSWNGPHAGNHIVFNSQQMKVYDHIGSDGERKESIYNAVCFANTGDC